MDNEHRLELAVRDTEEIITRDELQSILETNTRPRAYWGFEASGMMHIGTGLVCGRKIIDLVEAGFDYTVLLADWHSWINNKLGGDMANIHVCGEYMKQCFTALGISPSKVTYMWGGDLETPREYWEKVVRIAKTVNISRILRALPIMGRSIDGGKDLEAAAAIYPCMQAADIFQLKLDVACAGMDQRKAHVLARDVAEKLGWRKPTSLHTHLLPGLLGATKMDTTKYDEDQRLSNEISSKMSKSIPESSIIVHDEPETIKTKIRNAFCPPKETENNAILEIARHISFPWLGSIQIDRPAKYGGSTIFNAPQELEQNYKDGKVHPLDLKNAIAESLIKILAPVRNEVHDNPELLRRMEQLQITR